MRPIPRSALAAAVSLPVAAAFVVTATAAIAVPSTAATAAAAAKAPTAAKSQPASGTASPAAEQDQQGVGNVGARLPFVEQQAENARTNGRVIGPDRAYGTLAAEAVGRKAVRLQGKGKYVTFTLTKPANAVNVHYSIPDTANGVGRNATLGVFVAGHKTKSLHVTSKYSWYYGVYPWSNTPADGGRRQLYDDSRIMFGSTLRAGTKVRLQVRAQDTSPWYVIDTADFQKVAAPAHRPANSLSVLKFGADRTGRKNSSNAIQATIDAASRAGKTVWIPSGTFTVTRHLIVDKVTVKGAGPWYTVLHGNGVGVYGKYNPTPSSDVHLSGFAVFGEVKNRDDAAQRNAIGGALNDSTVSDVWLQHTKVGLWLDGPFDNLKISNVRILDQTADGINFHDGVTNSSVTNTFVRNTGDDGLAMWSDKHPDAHNTFAHNTVQVPTLANNIAIYGGSDNTVTRNLVTDTITQGGGIQIANRFGSVPLAGTTRVTHNVLRRTGTLDLFAHIGNPAMWFWAGDEAMDGHVVVAHNRILDSSYAAIGFTGYAITNVVFRHDLIARAGTFAVQLNTSGSATFSHVVATGLGSTGRYDCNSGFKIIEGAGNRGWSTSQCGYPAPGPLKLSAQNLSFVAPGVGKVSDPQVVTVTNPTNKAERIASITNTGSFTFTTTCTSVLAPHSSCTVSIRFAPTALGDRGGALTVSDGTPAGRYQVYITGTVQIHVPGNLADGKPATVSSQNPCCTAANLTDSNTGTYWESAAGAAFPQTATVDLGAATTISKTVFKINPAWGGTRTENLQILGSTDGTNFTTLAPAADYVFDSTKDNTVSISFAAASVRYVQVKVSSNTGWPAAQIAEFEVYA